METSLHRELKRLYAGDTARMEVRLEGFRIDAVVGDELVEIQHGSLAAIRQKLKRLLQSHRVRLVKPIVASKVLVKRPRKGGKVVSRRKSPKRGTVLDVFHELIYMTGVFPHPALAIEVPLVDVEEWRYPGHGRRRRRRDCDFIVEDQRLTAIRQSVHLATTDDLIGLTCRDLPKPFHTGHLAERLTVPRHFAQKIAYCFRKMGAANHVGKQGNALLYELQCADPLSSSADSERTSQTKKSPPAECVRRRAA